MGATAQVSSTVMFVAQLDRSVQFYTDVFGCEVTAREQQRAVLDAGGGFLIHLREIGPRAPRPLRAIGMQSVMWTADSREALDALEQALRERDDQVHKHEIDELTVVEGRDPDRVPVVIAYPDPARSPRRILDARLYSW